MIHLRSDRELDLMRIPGLAVHYALEMARKRIKPGATTGEINQRIAEYFGQLGGEPLFLNYPHGTAGKPPFPGVICSSVNEEVVHGIPGPRVLNEGDIVSIDTGVRLDGWCGDSAMTFPVGKVSPEVQRLLDVTKGCLDLAIDLMPQKRWWSEVAAEMATYVRDHKLYVVEDFVGHGIGRQMHEEPQVPNYASPKMRRTADFRLEPGLVIAVEPMVNLGTKKVKAARDHWTQSTKDGKPSAHFEHTLALTYDGVRILTAPPTAEERGLLQAG